MFIGLYKRHGNESFVKWFVIWLILSFHLMFRTGLDLLSSYNRLSLPINFSSYHTNSSALINKTLVTSLWAISWFSELNNNLKYFPSWENLSELLSHYSLSLVVISKKINFWLFYFLSMGHKLHIKLYI